MIQNVISEIIGLLRRPEEEIASNDDISTDNRNAAIVYHSTRKVLYCSSFSTVDIVIFIRRS